jgi:hypothetical protein
VLIVGAAIAGIFLNADWKHKAEAFWDNLTDKPPQKPPVKVTPKDDLSDILSKAPQSVDASPSDDSSSLPSATPTTLPTTAPTLATTRPSPSDAAVAPAPVAPTTHPAGVNAMSLAEMSRRADTLYQQARDAEVRLDFAQAVQLLEEIEKLPPTIWPQDTDFRLKLNRKLVAKLQQ